MKHLWIFLLSCILSLPSLAVGMEGELPDLLDITEWEVPWGGRPRDPFVAPDGDVWFCGQAGNYLGQLEPESGIFIRYEIPAGTHPHNLLVDDRGRVWYAGNRNAHIGRLDPATGKLTQYPMPKSVTDPHTLVFNQQGNLWFTAQQSNAIGFLNADSEDFRIVRLESQQARPYGIKVDADNRPWIVLLGTNRLATVNPQSFALREIELPDDAMRPRRLEIGADGTIWYVDYVGGWLGSYDPGTGDFQSWLMPGGKDSRPYGTALDASGMLWIAETGPYPNRLIGFDTGRQAFVSASEVPSGGAIRHMYYDDDSDDFWFGVDSGYIGRGKFNGVRLNHSQ